jgi:hypothetical protein
MTHPTTTLPADETSPASPAPAPGWGDPTTPNPQWGWQQPPSSALLGSTVPAVLLVQVWAPQVIVMPAFGAPAGARWSQRHRRQRYCR